MHESLPPSSGRVFLSTLGDILPYIYEWVIILSLVILWLLLTFLLPVPGCPTGVLCGWMEVGVE